MRLSRLAKTPAPRVALAALLAAVAVGGGIAAGIGSLSCHAGPSGCAGNGIVRWSRPLAGSWIANNGVDGTVFRRGQAFATAGDGLAVIGFGLTVRAFDVATGSPRWTQILRSAPPGWQIVSVRAFDGVVAVGVGAPSGTAAGGQGATGTGDARREIVLDAVTGRRLRSYPAAGTGGAVWASARRTVIVGGTSVTAYSNATGRAVWRDPTGPAGQAWRVDGRRLYVTLSARGQLGTAPVTAVRQIDLVTGSERLIRTPGGSFDGALVGVTDGILVFAGSSGISTYSVADGHLTGHRDGAVVQSIDPVFRVLYADVAGTLTALDPVTARNETSQPGQPPTGVFAVRGGVALGLDPGQGGGAWGYSMAKRQIAWTARLLPWPHYFADQSGLGGAVDPRTGTVLLVSCAQAGRHVFGTVVGGDGQVCLKPRLVALGPWWPQA